MTKDFSLQHQCLQKQVVSQKCISKSYLRSNRKLAFTKVIKPFLLLNAAIRPAKNFITQHLKLIAIIYFKKKVEPIK